MNLGAVSLILLLAAIVIGFWRKANVGILCIGFSMILMIHTDGRHHISVFDNKRKRYA